MSNYVNRLPRDIAGEPLQEFPAPVRTVASTVAVENAVASSAMSFHPNTVNIEVHAINAPVAIRWVPTTETATVPPRASIVASGLTANLDHIIHANTYRRFALPLETRGAGTGAHQKGSTFGLIQRMALINASPSPASVLVLQY